MTTELTDDEVELVLDALLDAEEYRGSSWGCGSCSRRTDDTLCEDCTADQAKSTRYHDLWLKLR